MTAFNTLVADFLAQKRIAVAGVSRSGGAAAANGIYNKLKNANYQVFAVNPNASQVEGDPCYPNLRAIPGGVEAVLVATHPNVAPQIVQECIELGISRVWLHRSFGQGSVSTEAIELGRRHGLTVIPAGCPMMFLEPDIAHTCVRWILGFTGGLPKEV